MLYVCILYIMFLKDIENTKNILILVEYIFGRYLLVKLLSDSFIGYRKHEIVFYPLVVLGHYFIYYGDKTALST